MFLEPIESTTTDGQGFAIVEAPPLSALKRIKYRLGMQPQQQAVDALRPAIEVKASGSTSTDSTSVNPTPAIPKWRSHAGKAVSTIGRALLRIVEAIVEALIAILIGLLGGD